MAATKRSGDLDPLVQSILNETKPGEDEHAQRVRRYDQSYEIYRGSAPIPANLESYRSKLRPKYGMQKIDTAMVNMAQAAPACKVMPRRSAFSDSAKKFQLGMNYFVDQDHLADKVPVTSQQALIYGVTMGKTHWLYQTGQATRPHIDPMTGARGAHTETVVLRDGPSYEPWDIYDGWWEPNARNVDNAEWVALRTWASKTYLEQNRCSVTGAHDWWECDGLYHNLDELYQAGSGRRPTSSAQDRILGGATNLRKDKFEVVEYWRDDRLTVIGNKQILLRDMPNPHWHGKKPVVVASCRPDLFKMQGVPLTELVDDLQQALWMIENIRQENIHLTTWRAFTYRTTSDFDPNTIEIRPRAMVPVADHDDLKPIEVQPLPPEAYEEEQVLLARLDDVTGITPYVSGAALGTVNQNTATGVSILNSAASVLLRFMANQVYKGVWQRVFEQWGDDVQQFLERDVEIRIEGPDAAKMAGPGAAYAFDTLSPQDVVGEYDFKLEGSEESLSKAQERQDAISLLTALVPLIQAGLVNPKPLGEKVARAFGFDNPDELFNQPPGPMPPAAPFGQQPGNGALAHPGQVLTNGSPAPLNVQQMIQGGGR